MGMCVEREGEKYNHGAKDNGVCTVQKKGGLPHSHEKLKNYIERQPVNQTERELFVGECVQHAW